MDEAITNRLVIVGLIGQVFLESNNYVGFDVVAITNRYSDVIKPLLIVVRVTEML